MSTLIATRLSRPGILIKAGTSIGARSYTKNPRRRNYDREAMKQPDTSGVELPARTVPEHLLSFKGKTYFASDTSYRWPNVHGVHLAEFKVAMTVRTCDLDLSKVEKALLEVIARKRYNTKTEMLRLVGGLFPSRIENKKYVTYQLEVLLDSIRNKAREDGSQREVEQLLELGGCISDYLAKDCDKGDACEKLHIEEGSLPTNEEHAVLEKHNYCPAYFVLRCCRHGQDCRMKHISRGDPLPSLEDTERI